MYDLDGNTVNRFSREEAFYVKALSMKTYLLYPYNILYSLQKYVFIYFK